MTDEQTAAAIVADPMNAVSETAMEAAIVRALQQAREEGKRSSFDSTNPPDPKPLVWLNGKKVAPAGHIIDDQGVVRRVKAYDTLDGRIWEEWNKRHEVEPITLEQVHAAGLRVPDGFTDAADFIKHVRGQSEAAEAAKEAK